MTSTQELSKGLLTLKVIWFAMLTSLVIYLLVGLFAVPMMAPFADASLAGIIRPFLYFVSIATLTGTWFIRKVIMPKEGSQQSLQDALSRYTTAMIVALALSESIGIFGLVLFMLGRDQMDLYLLIAVSGIAMLIYRPQEDAVLSSVRGGVLRTSRPGL